MTDAASPDPTGSPEIVARPAWDYRLKRVGLVIVALGLGFYFLYDGYVGYPKANAEAAEKRAKIPHTDGDIQLQKVLGYCLPVAALALLARWMFRSRGQVRLADDTLFVPGAAPIPISAMKSIDEANLNRWKRKGIVDIPYQLPGMTEPALVRLDDDPYQPAPMGEIFRRIRARTNPELEAEERDQDIEDEPSDSADDPERADDRSQ
jgi:hypothetical protein